MPATYLTRISLALILAGCALSAQALQSDYSKPIDVVSEQQMADLKANRIVFEGNVEATQGTMKIKADKVEVERAADGKLKSIVAYGNPVTFEQTLDSVVYDEASDTFTASVTTTNNFVFVMIEGATSPIPEFLRLTLTLATVYGVLFFATATIYTYYAAVYIGPGIASYIVFRRAFGAVAVQATSGLIYTILFVLPLSAFTLVAFSVLSAEIKPIVLSSGRGKSRLPVKCNAAALWAKFKPVLILNAAIIFAFWLIFYLILLFFVK